MVLLRPVVVAQDHDLPRVAANRAALASTRHDAAPDGCFALSVRILLATRQLGEVVLAAQKAFLFRSQIGHDLLLDVVLDAAIVIVALVNRANRAKSVLRQVDVFIAVAGSDQGLSRETRVFHAEARRSTSGWCHMLIIVLPALESAPRRQVVLTLHNLRTVLTAIEQSCELEATCGAELRCLFAGISCFFACAVSLHVSLQVAAQHLTGQVLDTCVVLRISQALSVCRVLVNFRSEAVALTLRLMRAGEDLFVEQMRLALVHRRLSFLEALVICRIAVVHVGPVVAVRCLVRS